MVFAELFNKLKSFAIGADNAPPRERERPATRPFRSIRPVRPHDDDRTRPSHRINDARWREIHQAMDEAG